MFYKSLAALFSVIKAETTFDNTQDFSSVSNELDWKDMNIRHASIQHFTSESFYKSRLEITLKIWEI